MNTSLNKLSNLQQRVLFGSLAAVGVVGVLWLGKEAFVILFALIALLALKEFFSLLKVSQFPVDTTIGMNLGGLILGVAVAHYLGFMSPRMVFPLIAGLFLLFIKTLYARSPQPITRIAHTCLGLIYVIFPFISFIHNVLYFGDYHFLFPLGHLGLLWASDTGAYFVGKFVGKTKLFESISPKKTWEGFLGGWLISMAISGLLYHFQITPLGWHWFVLSTFTVVFGTWGDLVESMFKRSLQLKDSGNFLPGHGGLLDRFDGLLVSAPLILVYLELFVR